MRGKGKLSILAAVIAATGGAAWAAPAPRPELLEHGSGPGDDYLLLGNGAGERVVVVPRGDAYPPGLDLVRSRPGAPFGPPVRLRDFRLPAFEDASAIAPDGTMAIVGEPAATRPNQTHRLVAIVRDAGASFGRPRPISGRGADEASIAFDRQSVATAIWTRDARNGFASYVEASTRAPRGDWTKPILVAYERRGASSPQIAFDAAGDAIAVWTREGSPLLLEPFAERGKRHVFQSEVVASIRPVGGAFARPQVLSDPSFDSDDASLSVNPAGQAAVAWDLNTKGDLHFRVGAAFMQAGDMRFGRPRFLTPDGRDSYDPHVALDEQGRALFVWAITGDRRSMESSDNQVVAAVRDPGKPRGHPVRLSDRHADFPEMAMAPDGHAVVAWSRMSRDHDVVLARRISTAGGLGPVTQVSPRGWIDGVHAHIADSGSASLTWIRGKRLEAAAVPRGNR